MLLRDTNGVRPLVETSRDTNPGDVSRRADTEGTPAPGTPSGGVQMERGRAGAGAGAGRRRADTVNKNTISSSDMPILLEA